jgi:hypothetical protein
MDRGLPVLHRRDLGMDRRILAMMRLAPLARGRSIMESGGSRRAHAGRGSGQGTPRAGKDESSVATGASSASHAAPLDEQLAKNTRTDRRVSTFLAFRRRRHVLGGT